MSRNTWNIQVKSSGSWGAITTIYRPNDAYSISKISTQTKTQLADGDTAYITPSTKYTNEPLVFIWYQDDGTIKAQIDGYITGGSDLKLTDDLGNIYFGRFLNIESKRPVGKDTAKYDIQATFENMPSIE